VNLRRLKVLKAFRLRAPHHRYHLWRVIGLSVSMGILLVIPLSGLMRIDLWRGKHLLFFEPTTFNRALAAIIVAFSVIYAATFLINLVAGRMFCGWGCPIGQLHRLSENGATPGLSPTRRWFHRLLSIGYSALMPLSILVWWIDLRVVLEGTANERALFFSAIALGGTLAWAHGRWWGWNFCRQACPIGLYYSFVAPARWFGITFPRPDACIDCNLCDHVCPVGLLPRSLADPVSDRGGISIADAPGRNHCLECGDCVRACEWIVPQQSGGIAPLELGFHSPVNPSKGES
jgi:ferredoxin-type protein NapH